MITLRLFGDESQIGHEANPQTGFYVAAGWIGRLEAWADFDVQWRQALLDEKISAFHMGPCEKGSGDFKGKTPPERERLQKLFVGIISRHRISGLICAVAYSPWRKYENAIRELMPPHLKHFVQPHIFAMHGLTVAATRAAAMQDVPPTEQISFVFDRHFQFQGRVEDLWLGGALRNTQLERYGYLGDLSHGDKRDHPGLQAADILAYEEFRRLSGDRDRWQIKVLEDNGQILPREIMNQKFMKIALHSLRTVTKSKAEHATA